MIKVSQKLMESAAQVLIAKAKVKSDLSNAKYNLSQQITKMLNNAMYFTKVSPDELTEDQTKELSDLILKFCFNLKKQIQK
jgi:hypothetical protein